MKCLSSAGNQEVVMMEKNFHGSTLGNQSCHL